MKKILYFMLLIIGVITSACSSKDEPTVFEVSAEALEFDANGGEQQIVVTSSENWSFICDEGWLTIRRNQNGLRVIADENTTNTERTAAINVYVGNKAIAAITVSQNAVTGIDGFADLSVSHQADSYSFKHNFNSSPTVETDCDWCSATCKGDYIIIDIQKNNSLAERKSSVKVSYKDFSSNIVIIQAGCPWYESFDMVYIEGGSFLMGAQSQNTNSSNYDINAFTIEAPVHEVNLSAYYMSAFEVTQAQWIAAMGDNPSVSQLGGQYPVENVSWDDVQVFIKKLCEASGKKYRLPTEAEWEYAAKGGVYNDKYLFAGGDVPSALGWFYSNSKSSIHEIGMKLPNSLGLYDLTGNVSEWVSDWFANYTNDAVSNPEGPSSGSLKINRGGSCNASSKNCRNTYRNMDNPSEKRGDLGFRVVLSD